LVCRSLRFFFGEFVDFRWLDPPLRTTAFPREVILTRLAIAFLVFIFGMVRTSGKVWQAGLQTVVTSLRMPVFLL